MTSKPTLPEVLAIDLNELVFTNHITVIGHGYEPGCYRLYLSSAIPKRAFRTACFGDAKDYDKIKQYYIANMPK